MKTLVHSIRFLLRSKAYTLISLLGLAFSLACCIILMRYIHRELTVDTHCVDREQVYAIQLNMEGSEHMGSISAYQYDPIELDKSLIEVSTRFTPLNEDFLMVNGYESDGRNRESSDRYRYLCTRPVAGDTDFNGHALLANPQGGKHSSGCGDEE